MAEAGVLPSDETIEDGTYQPLSRPIFIYVNMKAAEKPEMKEFVTFYMKNASMLVKERTIFSTAAQSLYRQYGIL